jgi:hypothetical protein
MTADISTDISAWSATAGSNQPDYADSVGPNNLADNLRAIQAAVRYVYSLGSAASAATVNLASVPQGSVSISGTTTITALGTVAAGITKKLIFEGILTLTHNGSSLILPGAANVTTAAGDVAEMLSLGSGNWRCVSYQRATGFSVTFGAVLSGIGPASAANAIGNADYAQRWNWALTSPTKTGFLVGESVASTGGSGSQYLGGFATNIGSTANPFYVKARADSRNAIDVSREGNVNISGPSGSVGFVTVRPGPAGTLNLGEATGGQVLVRGAAGFDINTSGGAGAIDVGSQPLTITGGAVSINAATSLIISADPRLASGRRILVIDGVFRPALTSGFGSGATVNGTDAACAVIIGSFASTSMVLTWNTPFTNAPIVQVSCDQSGITLAASPTTTECTITASAAMTAGRRLFVTAIGYV